MRKLAASAFLATLHLSSQALGAEPYRRLPAVFHEGLAQCKVTAIDQRETPSRLGRFFGAVWNKASAAELKYSHGIAILVGISEYGPSDLRDLPGVRQDIENMKELLTSDEGVGQGYDTVITLLDADVTAVNLRCVVGAVGTLSARDVPSNGHRLLFYWSGHGVDKEEGQSPIGYLPYYGLSSDQIDELSSFDMRRLSSWAHGFFGSFTQAVFLLDACMSGFATVEKGGPERKGAAALQLPEGQGYSELVARLAEHIKPFKVVLTAANKQQPAYENRSGGDFTSSYIALMSSPPSEDLLKDIDFHAELASLMRSKREERNSQREQEGLARLEGDPKPMFEYYRGQEQEVYFVPATTALVARLAAAREQYLSAAEESKPPPSSPPADVVGGGSIGSQPNELVDFCAGDEHVSLGTLSVRQLLERARDCELAAKTVTDPARIFFTRGNILLELAARASGTERSEYYREAMEDFRKAGPVGVSRIAGMMFDGLGFERSPENDIQIVAMAQAAYEAGDKAQAPNILGLMHERGVGGLSADIVTAKRYYEESSTNGYASGARNLAIVFAKETNYAEAERYYIRAGELGRTDSFIEAANLNFEGRLAKEQTLADRDAARLVARALQADPLHAWALNYYGWLHRVGRGVDRNDVVAAEYFERSRARDFPQASLNLGSMYRLGEGVVGDFSKAAELFTAACDGNLAGGCAELADMMLDRAGFADTDEVKREAYSFVERALTMDPRNRFAIELKAYCARFGLGTPVDLAVAEQFFRMAGQAGSAWAWRSLGLMLRDQIFEAEGDEWDRRVRAAHAALQEAVALGDSEAMMVKAEMYLDTLGTDDTQVLEIVPRLLEKPDREGKERAFDLLLRFHTTDSFGQPDPAGTEGVFRRLLAKQTSRAYWQLGNAVANLPFVLPENTDLRFDPPWEYFARCGDLGDRNCHWLAAEILFKRGQDESRKLFGEMTGLFERPSRQTAVDLSFRYIQRAADSGDPDALMALGAFNLAPRGTFLLPTGFEPSRQQAAGLFDRLKATGDKLNADAGLTVSGLLDGTSRIGFETAFDAARSFSSDCGFDDALFTATRSEIWPGFDCGWSDQTMPYWQLGVARTSARLNLRAEPGSAGAILAELPAETALVYLLEADTVEPDWVRVHAPGNHIGWVFRKFLSPWADTTASR